MIREEVPAGPGPAPASTAALVPAVCLPPFLMAERSLASVLLRLLAVPGGRLAVFAGVDWGKALSWLRGRSGAAPAAEREQAVRLALTSRVAVLTGDRAAGRASPSARW